MQSNASALPITEQQLAQQTQRANGFITSVKWTPAPPPSSAQERGKDDALYKFRLPSTAGRLQQQEVSILKIAQTINADPLLLTEDVNYALHSVRQGLRIGFHLSALYAKSSGLEALVQQNRPGITLSDSQQTEFRAKQVTAAAVAVFTSAQFITWQLGQYKPNEVGSVNLDFAGIPEFALRNPIEAIQCALYYYGAYLEQSGVVRTPLDFVKMTLLYFRGIIDEIKLRQESLQYADAFTQNVYKLENSDFSISGFTVDYKINQISVIFNRIKLDDDIVGNRDAKHFSRRLCERLLCFDPVTKRNVMYDLRALPIVSMGCGLPGGGKSLMIAAIATLLDEGADKIGIPFLFWPIPDNIVSSYQGTTSERMYEWMKVFRDPTKVIYGPVDDAEGRFQDRTHEHISEGGRSVVETFLRNSEGASAVWHGNAVLQFYTNYPEQLDAAVLSRVMSRTYINGAESWQDFLDQDYRWWMMYAEFDPTFVDMEHPKDYQYFSAQRRLKSLSEISTSLMYPEDEKIREVFDRVKKQRSLKEHRFFGEFFEEMKKAYSFFSSRDVRNIQLAVSERVMDFDLPQEWLDKPDTFYRQNYDQKKVMVTDLMRQNMKGLSFAQIRLQETIRYVSTAIKIQDAARERKIRALMEDALIREEARERLLALQR